MKTDWKFWFSLAVTIVTSVGFAMFMFEESLQTVMFATWQAKGDRTLHAKVYREILNLAETFTYAVGWTNPLAFISYVSYWKAAEVWYASAYSPQE